MKIHEINGYIASLYLVETNQGLLLLDSGCRCDVEIVQRFIENTLNKKMEDLKLVIVTHAHPDHSGGASFYKEKFKTKIAGPENVNNWYRGFEGILTYGIDLLLTYLVALRKKKGIKNILFPRKLRLDFALKDGDAIPGFENWKVLQTPGHTTDDLTLYCQRENTAYIADMIVGQRKEFFRPYPLSLPGEYKKSLQKYIDLKIETFLMAHYGINVISEDQIKKNIDKTPSIPRVHRNTLPTILKHLLRAFFTFKK